jgi:hypothetical protein
MRLLVEYVRIEAAAPQVIDERRGAMRAEDHPRINLLDAGDELIEVGVI